MKVHRVHTITATFHRIGPAGLRTTTRPTPPLTLTVPEHTGRHRDASARYIATALHRYVLMWMPETIRHYRVDVDLTDARGTGTFTITEELVGAARHRGTPRDLGGGTITPEEDT